MESKIIWSIDALKQLEDIHFFILFESKSISIADKVIDKIFESTAVLKTNPEIYKLDKLKTKNDGTFRTYFVYDFQISYRINTNIIQILRVRHNSRKPKDLK
ncbi:MAG: type II toxin-antitoxin system RelE/ParE family toxin [Flavobacterium sp.]|uniref:type II toxin-antitoxin system RelE/ParE family toxin n=1 Tax=Flavobacterium sp. TaxID=239 RepID=UPI003266BEB4